MPCRPGETPSRTATAANTPPSAAVNCLAELITALFISYASFRVLVNHVPAGEDVPRASSRAVEIHSMRTKLFAQVIFDLAFCRRTGHVYTARRHELG